MAWITVSSVDTRFCYTQLQYDDSSTGNNRSCRLVMAPKASTTVSSLTYWNVTVNGTNYGAVSGVDLGDVIWSGSLPAGERGFSFYINWYDLGSTYYSGSGYIPTGVTMTARAVLLENYWNSIKVNSTLSTWSGNTNNRFESFVIAGSGTTSSNIYNKARATLRTVNTSSLEKNEVFTNAAITAGLNQVVLSSPTLYRSEVFSGWNSSAQIKGCFEYQIATYAYNNTLMDPLAYDINSTVYHTPPAPGVLTGGGEIITPTQTITYTGVAANNAISSSTNLVRYVRWREGSSSNWTYIENGTQRAITYVTTAEIPVNPQATVYVEAWMAYYGNTSEISTATIHSNAVVTHDCKLYGSVNGLSEKIEHLYGSVNGESKKIIKLYGSVNGRSKLIHKDI